MAMTVTTWRRRRRGCWTACGPAGPAISATRDGPVLLRVEGELAAVDVDGTILAGPDGPFALVRGPLPRFPGKPGCHRLLDASATVALTR
jgi:hypothetical protein